MEWALPVKAGFKYEKMVEELKSFGKYDEYKQFVRGGFFRNFFAKYPESNNIHKKMLYVSEKIATLGKGKKLGLSSQSRDNSIKQRKTIADERAVQRCFLARGFRGAVS